MEVKSPPRMTTAIGPSISRPGSPMPMAKGRTPRAVTSEVIRMAANLSAAPRIAVSASLSVGTIFSTEAIRYASPAESG